MVEKRWLVYMGPFDQVESPIAGVFRLGVPKLVQSQPADTLLETRKDAFREATAEEIETTEQPGDAGKEE